MQIYANNAQEIRAFVMQGITGASVFGRKVTPDAVGYQLILCMNLNGRILYRIAKPVSRTRNTGSHIKHQAIQRRKYLLVVNGPKKKSTFNI